MAIQPSSMTSNEALETLTRLNDEFFLIADSHRLDDLVKRIYITTEKGSDNTITLKLEFKETGIAGRIKSFFHRIFHRKYYIIKEKSLTTLELQKLKQALQAPCTAKNPETIQHSIDGLNNILEYIKLAKIADCHGKEKKEQLINELFRSLKLERQVPPEKVPEVSEHVEDLPESTIPADAELVAQTGPSVSAQPLTMTEPVSEAQILSTTQPPALTEPLAPPESDAQPVESSIVEDVIPRTEVAQKQVTAEDTTLCVYNENQEVFEALGISLSDIRDKNQQAFVRAIEEKITPGLARQEATEYGVSGSLLQGVYSQVYKELSSFTENPQEKLQTDSEDWLKNVDRLAKLVLYEKTMLKAHQREDPETNRMLYMIMLQELVRKTENYMRVSDIKDTELVNRLYEIVHTPKNDSLYSAKDFATHTTFNLDQDLDRLKRVIHRALDRWGQEELERSEKIHSAPRNVSFLPYAGLVKELEVHREKIEPSLNVFYQIRAIAIQPAESFKEGSAENQCIYNEVFQAALQADPATRAQAARRKADEFFSKSVQPDALIDLIEKMAIIGSLNVRVVHAASFRDPAYLQQRVRDVHSTIDDLRTCGWIAPQQEAACHVYVAVGKWQELKQSMLTALLEQKLEVSPSVATRMYNKLQKSSDSSKWAEAIQKAEAAEKGHRYKALCDALL